MRQIKKTERGFATVFFILMICKITCELTLHLAKLQPLFSQSAPSRIYSSWLLPKSKTSLCSYGKRFPLCSLLPIGSLFSYQIICSQINSPVSLLKVILNQERHCLSHDKAKYSCLLGTTISLSMPCHKTKVTLINHQMHLMSSKQSLTADLIL